MHRNSIFEWDLQNLNSDSWCGKIWYVFDLLNLHDVFENGVEVHLSGVKSKFNIIMQSMWCQKLSYKPKLRTYLHIKNTIKTKPFLKGNISKFQCSLLTQLRIDILPFAVETVRYNCIPLETYICQICNENFIEDEIHFVCKCSACNLVGENFFSKFNAYSNINKMDAYHQFCNTCISKPENIKLLVDYINKLWNITISILFCFLNHYQYKNIYCSDL